MKTKMRESIERWAWLGDRQPVRTMATAPASPAISRGTLSVAATTVPAMITAAIHARRHTVPWPWNGTSIRKLRSFPMRSSASSSPCSTSTSPGRSRTSASSSSIQP